MRNKKLLLFFIILLISVVVITYFYTYDNKKNVENTYVKFGAILPLTGESAYWGKNIKDGIELAKEEINQNGGILSKKVQIIYEDTKGNSKDAVNAVNKLISEDNIKFIIGDVISSNILAVAPILEKNKVLMIGFGEAAEITNAGDYIFRNWNSAASDAIITGNFATTQTKKIILLSRNDAFGNSAVNLFKKTISEKIEIVDEIKFDTKNYDFRSIISSFIKKDYDGIYFAGFHKEALIFLRQYIELGGKNVNIYGVSSWEENSLIDFIKNNYKGNVYYGYPKPPDTNLKPVKQFISNFERKYHKKPEILNDNGYDALYMYKTAIEKVNSFETSKVKEGLYQLKNYVGATGKFSVDKNGDVEKPFGLKIINKNGNKWLK